MFASPRLTVGLPVYNGQNFLTESLDALLAQTYTDFELIISDNASTDATEEICREYAARDPRIRYVRQPVNIGANPNHNFVVQVARGEFLKWASHDDLYAPQLLESCVEALDERRDVVLAHAHMAIVDAQGGLVEKYDYRIETDSPDAPTRFRSLLWTDGGDDQYGVIRTDVLRRVTPIASYHNPGRTLVAELALHGPFHQVPEVMYFRRDHPGRGDRRGSINAICENLDPNRRGQSSSRLVAEYLAGYVAAIRRAPLSAADRRRCYQYYLEWLGRRVMRGPAAPPQRLVGI
jgi:glycosyltransferase involved in cell wall biosynthesis